MPFNTRNPIPSGDLRDLDDNARNIDVWANDKTKLSHPDRFGVERRTWHGIEQEAKLNIQQAIDAKNAAQEAAMMSGFSKYADTLAQMEAGIGTDYVDGDVVLVFQDESRGGTSSIYKVESGVAVFKNAFDKTRQDLLSFTGTISADAEWSDVPAHSDPAFDVQAQALADRTDFLKSRVDAIPDEVDAAGTAEQKVDEHNSNPNAHPEMHDFISAEANRAEAARDAAVATAGPLYATETEGRAAVADGETFAVQGDGDVAAIVYRKIDAASSEAIASIASVRAIESLVTKTKMQSAYIPLVSLGRKIVMWHEADGLNASEVSRGLKQEILKNTVSEFSAQSHRIPLLGFGRKIYAYLDETGVGFSSLSDKFKRNLYRELSEYSEHPIATDGRHLGMWRNKQALFNSGVADTKLRVGFVGDSWSEMNVIPGRFRKKLLDTYGIAGQGFRAVVSGNRLVDTPSLTRSSEWVLYDGSSDSVLPYGAGVDGQSIVTDSASATLNLSGITGNLVKIFHRGYGGTFRYRTDGGPWVAVTAPNDSKNHTITVNIPGAGSHTIDIDTQGNSGAVVITGFYITGDGIGAEISKMGNGGLTGAYMNNWVGSIGEITPEIGIDLMIVFLGTNDYRSASASVEKYTEALEKLIESWRTAQPNIGFILCAPPQSNGTAITPLSKYRDAMYYVAKNKGCEFIDMLTLWGDFNVTDSLGMWNDNLHVSNIGAERLVLDINNYFLKA